ncbi:MAG: 4'-phosphopantetheinyl transferase superfamily protein, partial [Massilia sp.]
MTTHAVDLAPLHLPDDALHVWLADPAGPSLELLAARYYGLLSADERERYHRYHFDADRQLYLAAHALLRLTLARYTGLSPAAIAFTRGPNGKPEALLPPPFQRLRVNLTHTRGQVGCVLSQDRDCGIDIEGGRPVRDLDGIARMMLSPSEIGHLAGLDADERQRGFFTLWTLKEAYAKATGEGIGSDLTRISFTIDTKSSDSDSVKAVTCGIGGQDAAPQWRFYAAT